MSKSGVVVFGGPVLLIPAFSLTLLDRTARHTARSQASQLLTIDSTPQQSQQRRTIAHDVFNSIDSEEAYNSLGGRIHRPISDDAD